jgi:DNA modification methylase
MEIKPNNIYLGDCYELIKFVPDKSIDLVITDPPYEFVMGGKGHSELGGRKYKSKGEIYALDTELTKKNIGTGYQSGGGCFGTKKRAYHSQLAPTDVSIARKKYEEYVKIHGKDEESERLRVIANVIDTKEQTSFISKGFDNSILDELCRVMKKINIYIWCNKNQLRQLIDYFDDKGCFVDLLTWNKTNPIPTCNNTYLSDIEYCVFAREQGVKIYGSVETKHKWFTSPCNTDDKDKYNHPTIKPLERIKQFIINSIDERERENSVVLDCFLGSGTTCVAAKELGCKYIGFELNPTFYQIAIDRLNGIDQNGQIDLLSQGYEQLDLFGDDED